MNVKTFQLTGTNLTIEDFAAIANARPGQVRLEIHPDSLNDIDASVVLVKGGPATMAYFYGTLQDSDVQLSAPINPKSGQPYGISHVEFCFDPKGDVDNPFVD